MAQDYLEPETELLYHYHFDISDMALQRLNISANQSRAFREVFLTTLAEEVARDLKENWLISKNRETSIVVNEGSEQEAQDIRTLYLKSHEIPEDVLYLDENGIELYSTSVEKIERNKTRIENLTQNMRDLVYSLVLIDESRSHLQYEEADAQAQREKIALILEHFNQYREEAPKTENVKFKA